MSSERNSRTRSRRRRKSPQPKSTVLPLVLVIAVFVCLCISLTVLVLVLANDSDGPGMVTDPEPDPRNARLTVAYSPEKSGLVQALVAGFNAQDLRTEDRERMRIELLELTPEAMVEEALGDPRFQAMTPDSSLWVDQLDRRWADLQQLEEDALAPSLIGESIRYAVSPVVIAMWEDVARSLDWPQQAIGWETIQQRASSDASFRWSHPSTSQASGLLATLAEFYAGAGKTRGLTEEDATAQSTLDYVAAIERTVKFYGEGEAAIMQRILEEGRSFLDAFVVQEHLVVNYNRQRQADVPELKAIYPVEGTLWADHPLVLLERSTLTDNQRQTFRAFRDYVQSAEAQALVLDAGFRPADLSIPLEGSPVSPSNGVDPRQPQTTLQVPGPAVVEVVQDVWYYTKRKTNVYLVVDTSGSMSGEKLAATQAALREFLDQIRGDQERVGLIEFSGQINNIDPLEELGANRLQLQRSIDSLEASGDTALLDAVRAAYVRLQQFDDPGRINAIVAMTDGRENASSVSLRQLAEQVRQGNRTGVPVVIFAIAFGGDADYEVMDVLAEASGGQVRQGDLQTIRELYRLLSSYF